MNKQIRWIVLFVAVCTGSSFAQQNPAPFTVQTATQSAVDIPLATAATSTSSISPTPTATPAYHDAQQRIVVQGDSIGMYGMRYDGTKTVFSELVDNFGNRTYSTTNNSGQPLELKHEFNQRPPWNERLFYDASGGLLLSDVDSGESTLPAKASQFGIKVGYPDWLKITFQGAKTINEVHVVTQQDNYTQGIVPLRASQPGGPTTFSVYGVTDYEVQYLDAAGKWTMIPGTYVTSNRDVARVFIFAPITTTAIRLVTKAGLGNGNGDYTRIIEVEAFEQNTHRNVALASQGGSATASTEVTAAPASATIDGEETGRTWGAKGGWRDDTPNIRPSAGTVTSTSEYGNYTRTNFSSQFASVSRLVNNNPPPTTPPKLGMQFMMEKADVTYAGGWHTFSAGAYVTKYGIEYWDNAGGSRIQSYDANKRLFYVTDWTDGWGIQPVIRVRRDAQARPTAVYLGSDLAVLEFVYDASGWLYTRLFDRIANKTYFGFQGRRSVAPPTALSYPELLHLTHGYMPQYGPIIEWHDSISPIPNIVVSLKGMPYALLRNVTTGFASGEAARYVITPFAGEGEPMTNIRVEYDAENIYLQVPTLNSGSMVVGRHMQAFRFSRHGGGQAATDSDFRPKSDLVPTTRYYGELFAKIQRATWSSIPGKTFTTASSARASTGSGQGAGGSGGGALEDDNDDYGYSETITVIGKDPGYPHFDPFPVHPFTPPSNPPESPPPPPPNPYEPPRTDECADDGGLTANPTDSVVGGPTPGATPCPTPGSTPNPCKPLDPQGPTKKQADWTKGFAGTAMKDPRCANFLANPSGAKPPGANRTYFEIHGYLNKPSQATLSITDKTKAQEVWNKMQVYDGTGSPNCLPPPCGGAAAFENSGNIFACPDGFNYYAGHGANGGVELQATLIHEYLHLLGLKESFPSAGDPPGKVYPFPTSQQIRDATLDACGPGIRAAQGGSTPPL
jgi:hypothetical protein